MMPPWVLSAKDLQEFVRGQSVRSRPARGVFGGTNRSQFPDPTSLYPLGDKVKNTPHGKEWLWSKVLAYLNVSTG